MCYTRGARLQDSFGGCNVRDRKEFEKVMGLKACFVCMGYEFDVQNETLNGSFNGEDFITDAQLDELATKAKKQGLLY